MMLLAMDASLANMHTSESPATHWAASLWQSEVSTERKLCRAVPSCAVPCCAGLLPFNEDVSLHTWDNPPDIVWVLFCTLLLSLPFLNNTRID